jgi:F-type H+-transporting ATPase subunit delta
MAAIDLRYARALASVVAEEKLDAVKLQVALKDFAATLEGSSQLKEVLADPSIPEAQKLKVLDVIAERIGLERAGRNFLAVVVTNQRLHELEAMIEAFSLLMEEASSVVEATVVSAHPLDAASRQMLEQKIAQMTGQQHVRASYGEDSALLGGAVITIGSTVYDGSIRAQLAQMKERLATAGA